MNDIRRTTVEEVAALLRSRIHRGELSPGDRLPAERDLAAQLRVARVTVRGALGALQQEGYLEVRRGATGGRFVTELAEPYGRWRSTMAADLRELTTVLEYRAALERQVAVLAAGRRTNVHLRRMRRAITDLAEAASPEDFRRADGAFHTALGAAAKNHLLAAAVADARGRLFSPTDRLGFEAHVETSSAAHLAIYEAVAAKDAAAAAAAIERHLTETAGELVEVLKPRGAVAPRPAGRRGP